jgi:hypothetical protein
VRRKVEERGEVGGGGGIISGSVGALGEEGKGEAMGRIFRQERLEVGEGPDWWVPVVRGERKTFRVRLMGRRNWIGLGCSVRNPFSFFSLLSFILFCFPFFFISFA